MDPGHANKPGFYSIFLFTHAVARKHGLPAVFGINTLGKRATSSDASTRLCEMLILLQATPHAWWADSLLNDEIVQNTINLLFAQGCVKAEKRGIRQCSCGNVEYFADVVLFSSKSLIRDGMSLCCHTHITESHKTVLTTTPLPTIPLPKVYPAWAEREFAVMLEKLAGSKLLLSRATPRRYRIVEGSMSWNIDNDVIWWLYAYWLRRISYGLDHLVVGTSTLRQAAVICSISALVGLSAPKYIYCLPKVFFAPVHNTKTLEGAIKQFGIHRVRNALLWSALSERKECTLSGSIFPSMRNVEVEAEHTLKRSSLKK